VSTVIEPHPSGTSGIDVHNPATGEKLYSISDVSEDQVSEIYDRARASFAKISGMTTMH